MQAGEHCFHAHGFARAWLYFRANLERGDGSADGRDHGNGVDGFRAMKGRVDDSAEGRPEDGGAWKMLAFQATAFGKCSWGTSCGRIARLAVLLNERTI